MTQGGDLGTSPSSPLFCLKCGKGLTGQQKKYCSRSCKVKYWMDIQGIPTRISKYREHKKDRCEVCGFVAVHKCQLDVDHVDGNKYNNDTSNLQTLCANCHRLKTQLNKEYLKKK